MTEQRLQNVDNNIGLSDNTKIKTISLYDGFLIASKDEKTNEDLMTNNKWYLLSTLNNYKVFATTDIASDIQNKGLTVKIRQFLHKLLSA